MATTIVTVWLASDADEANYIVDTDIVGGGESETIKVFDADEREDAIEYGREKARKLGVALHVDGKEEASAQLIAMEAMLEAHGDRFAGNCVTDAANDWLDNGFDADIAGDWCEIGVWNAATAAALRDAELTPDDAKGAAEWLADSVDDASEEFTDGDPIYAACNNDISASVIIDAGK